jgi:anti-sigma B factor antagonist
MAALIRHGRPVGAPAPGRQPVQGSQPDDAAPAGRAAAAAVHETVHGHRVVLRVTGEVEVYTTGELRQRLDWHIAHDRTDIVVDLTGVTFIDSTGLGVLVGAMRTVRPTGGRIELVADQAGILKLLRITALNRLFTVHPTLESALTER